ncbi:hypothetical protein UMNF18_1783 [Escherichia coli UMNF18]|nr:hypothetical protein UMNF18_1783 [Escherichia coli UMNF18]
MIRRGVSPDKVKGIKFISEEEPELIDEINEYIEDAIKVSHG